MNLLALESATEACSVALLVDGKLYERYQLAPQQHARLLLPMLDEVLADARLKSGDIDGVAYAHGPGSFTGIRIAAAMVQGIALGCEIPVVGISTLEALAHRAWREVGERRVLAAIDARMQEVYFGGFEVSGEGETQLVIAESVAAPGIVETPETGSWIGVGTGWSACDGELQKRFASLLNNTLPDLLPHAVDVALLAAEKFRKNEAVVPELAMPVYIRDKVAETEANRAAAKKIQNKSGS